jgi:hypothetical protein
MRLSFMVCALAVLPAVAGPASGTRQQDVPPIPGVTSAVAIEGTVDRFYNGVETIAVKTSDGIRHLFRVTKRTAVHGAGATGEAVDDLEDGTHVVVHYTGEGTDRTAVEVDRIGDDGLREMHGVLADLDREAKRLSIRLEDGTRETLQLTDRAARALGKDITSGTTVVAYYTYDDGTRVTHYLRAIRVR